MISPSSKFLCALHRGKRWFLLGVPELRVFFFLLFFHFVLVFGEGGGAGGGGNVEGWSSGTRYGGTDMMLGYVR